MSDYIRIFTVAPANLDRSVDTDLGAVRKDVAKLKRAADQYLEGNKRNAKDISALQDRIR